MFCRRQLFSDAFRSGGRLNRRLLSSTPNDIKPYYVTTPIFYPNAIPHIGHLYTIVTADIFARYSRLTDPNRPVHFVTGTDEHGLKIQRVAHGSSRDPQAFCDLLSTNFRRLVKEADVSATRFIRTTEIGHHRAAQHVWNILKEKGLIYKGKHSGWYSVTDECFYTNAQVAEISTSNNTLGGRYLSIETKSPVEWTMEENYMFRLTSFRDKLLEHIKSNPDFIYPPARYQEVLEFFDTYMQDDLSISRPKSRLSWGIPVPEDPGHTMYVWFEALVNYLTAIEYPSPTTANGTTATWPPDLQVMGKDIIRFHSLYFPAMLLALDLPLPKRLLVHSHWTVEKRKMSKSVGNVVDPFEMMDAYGTDSVRYFLARVGGRFKYDVDWSKGQFVKHSSELMSLVGNFYSRITAQKIKELLGPSAIPTIVELQEAVLDGKQVQGSEILLRLGGLRLRVQEHMRNLVVGDAIQEIVDVLALANKIYSETQPWLPSTEPSQRAQIHAISVETLRICGILLQPFIPGKSVELLEALGTRPKERFWDCAEPGKGTTRNLKQGVRLFIDPALVRKKPEPES
ncbi:tRNA synthetases class I (M)-domain-containing protein [Thelephora terrestris]|uniref:Probable methionine--tRNA ligase, mitochondrial n=1 Tax=Thelephora terrestris TaxID=56493 RepID=A0A9P6H4S0_9AGAM|nr:tRNA synthetases class I (M)-domain-containing protein [Thelephora terrestris]